MHSISMKNGINVQRIKEISDKMRSWSFPVLIEGHGSIFQLPEYIRSHGQRIMLIITDRIQLELGMLEELLSGLRNQGITCYVYPDTSQEATVNNIEEAAEMYGNCGCEGIIAFGGEPCMSCGKAAAARITRPLTSLLRLLKKPGLLRGRIPLYTVPVGACSGSESSAAAALLDQETGTLYKIADHILIPNAAVLDPALRPI